MKATTGVSLSPSSPAREEWDRQKTIDGDHNKAIDEIMNMIGLDEVKSKFLSIKTKVDTGVRQGSLSDCKMLESPFLSR
jgi:hypothetical protein